MNNDLISRKALINDLFVRNGKMCPDNDIDNFPVTINVKDVKESIRNAPTAYDVDKVTEILLKNEKVMEICLDKEFDKDLVSAIKSLFRTYTESQIKIVRESINNG